MIQYKLRQNTNSAIEAAFGKWYASPIVNETLDIDGLAEHMAAHNTPFSKGAIKGILTDMVACIKEELLGGNAVKIDDLAIFKVGIVSSAGCEVKSEYKASKYISGVRLRALATGELTTSNLTSGVTLKRASLDQDDEGDVEADEDGGAVSNGTQTGTTNSGSNGSQTGTTNSGSNGSQNGSTNSGSNTSKGDDGDDDNLVDPLA
jgi:predicted histone-like DNA-binding protein